MKKCIYCRHEAYKNTGYCFECLKRWIDKNAKKEEKEVNDSELPDVSENEKKQNDLF